MRKICVRGSRWWMSRGVSYEAGEPAPSPSGKGYRAGEVETNLIDSVRTGEKLGPKNSLPCPGPSGAGRSGNQLLWRTGSKIRTSGRSQTFRLLRRIDIAETDCWQKIISQFSGDQTSFDTMCLFLRKLTINGISSHSNTSEATDLQSRKCALKAWWGATSPPIVCHALFKVPRGRMWIGNVSNVLLLKPALAQKGEWRLT